MHRVGMIGLGKMGMPIARNLMDRGFTVTGYRRSGSPELAAAGGTVAGSPAEVAAGADVLLSIVPDAAAVREIIAGPAGTLTGLRPGTVHIEMSTIGIAEKAALRDTVREGGGDLLDCPVSGSPEMVAPRRATTFASGDEASVEAVGPVLDAVSGPWVYAGVFGAGAGSSTSRTCCWPCTRWPPRKPWPWPGGPGWTWSWCSAPWTARSPSRPSGASVPR